MGSRADLRIAIVPAASPAARALAAGLARRAGVAKVLCIDDSEPHSRGGTGGSAGDPATHALDVRSVEPGSPDIVTLLDGIDVLVLVTAADDVQAALASDRTRRRESTTLRAQAVLTAGAAAGVAQVVVVTSAMVYGATPDAPVPLPPDSPRITAVDPGLVGDLLAVEGVVDGAERSYPAMRIARLRPAALVGSGIDTVITRHFEAPRLLTVSGATMTWQFCHISDATTAVLTLAAVGASGVYDVASQGVLSQQEAEKIAGMRHIELPASLALSTARRLHRVGVLPMPPEDLFYVVYPWVVADERLRALGWAPAMDAEMCLSALLEEVRGHHAVAARRVERRDAALASAGAAVAVVSTAAAWRQARASQRNRRK